MNERIPKPTQVLPPTWCGGICRNSMNEKCLEHCALKRDCSGFEPKSNLKFSDMPRFPLKETRKMTREEKFAAVAVYLAMVVDHLNGVENEQNLPAFGRDSYLGNLRGREIVTDVINILQGSQDYAEGLTTIDTAQQNREIPIPLPASETIISTEGE